MFKKVLVANRGEIAVRVIRALGEMGIRSVAIHSEVDRNCLHVEMADEKICVGPGPSLESYLNIPNIISAALITKADAIHPGYGFLAENIYFAQVCGDSGISFIGPTPDTIKKMGDKIAARQMMKKLGVPVVPGTDGPVTSGDPDIFKTAKKIGYPIIVKASAGGGGKGMRIVKSEDELKDALDIAGGEAKKAFGNDSVYFEKYLDEPRHVEFQILGDKKGRIVYLPERDCSIQRRHQKLVEESPSTAVERSLRRKMGKTARLAAAGVKYRTVGTVEFLLDKKENFYFMEMNTRIQVEHPVTEMITGIDLVKEQIRLAAGETLDYDSDDIKINGHAIECRINAEDPDRDFIPSPGKVERFISPGGMGVRVETHLYSGYIIPSFYDSLLAKVIVNDKTRKAAIAKMRGALGEMKVEGIKTTLPLHKRIFENEDFVKGDVYTNFLQKHIFSI
ncbi:MAG: acetyl-CoA carboxylase biotin carboxylase subunit [Endomicrobiia bacterium]|nr:acetyl-CoA carboxylase biotin carboxylase subunit [Endomicrobiia bacterium]